MPAIPKATVKPGYKAQSTDTSIDADVLMFELLRQLDPLTKAKRVQTIDLNIRKLSPLKDMVEDPLALAQTIAEVLERLGIPYYLGGSLASSLWGEPRYSEDLDLVIAIFPEQQADLIAALEPHFYISEEAVSDVLEGRLDSFNIISLNSAEKVDFFVCRSDRFSVSKMQRRVQYPISETGSLWISSAEDIILQKLVWGRSSDSQKQWRDVQGVLKTRAGSLNYGYLFDWAEELGLQDVIHQALIEAGI